jgi:hypothetical protein
MAVNSFKNSFLIFIAFVYACLNAGCFKPCVQVNYNFKVSATFSPEIDPINVGDTLWFTSQTSTKMLNQLTGKEEDYGGAANFGSALGIRELIVGSDTLVDAVKDFSVLSIVGNVYTDPGFLPGRVKQLTYVEQNGFYKVAFAIIANRRGIYAFSIADAKNVLKEKCKRANIEITFSNADKHLHYLKDIYYKGAPIAEIDKTHVYCFEVK